MSELREQALMMLLEWAIECGFGYDNFPEEYEKYKDEINDMELGYIQGMIYIAEQEVIERDKRKSEYRIQKAYEIIKTKMENKNER